MKLSKPKTCSNWACARPALPLPRHCFNDSPSSLRLPPNISEATLGPSHHDRHEPPRLTASPANESGRYAFQALPYERSSRSDLQARVLSMNLDADTEIACILCRPHRPESLFVCISTINMLLSTSSRQSCILAWPDRHYLVRQVDRTVLKQFGR